MADALKEQGNKLLAEGDASGAIAAYSQAIDLTPENHILFSNRSAAYLKAGQITHAITDAEKCVELNPKWTKGHSRLGAAFHAAGRFDESISAYAQGLSLEPTNAALSQGLQAALQAKEKPVASNPPPSASPAPSEMIVGIDLGTTYSCIGVWQGDGVVIIPDAEGRRTTPSVVSYMTGEGGEIERLIGHDAKRKMTTNAKGTIFDAKRLIGQRFADDAVQRDVEKLPFKVVASSSGDDKPNILIESLNLRFTPEEVSAVILAEMKKIAENYLKVPVTRAIVTVPAYFSDAQRQATKDAGAIAGLNVLRVINEPTAAALAYGLDVATINAEEDDAAARDAKKKERKILVFDLGGGTFDVSVLSIENGVFEVMSTGGDTHLGGEDFDTNLAEYMMKEIKNKLKIDVDPAKKSRLKVAAELCKISLSNGKTCKVPLDGIVDGEGLSLDITRDQFDKINAEPFKRCMDTVKRVLKDAKLKPEDIADVVLVGGSTRIPTIRQMLRDLFGGKQLCQSINPDEAVAYGAAVQGAIMSRASAATSQLILVDVCPLSLGIECTGKVFSVVIPRNTPLPVKRTKTYSTEEDNQTAIDVRVFEGERQVTDGNNFLGEFMITGIERAKRGEPKIEVTFAISVDGILQVSALDLKTRATGNVVIAQNSGRLSQEEIARMLLDAERFRRQDEARTQKLEALNELDTLLSELAEAKVTKQIRTRAQKVKEWLEQGGREEATAIEIRTRMNEIIGEQN